MQELKENLRKWSFQELEELSNIISSGKKSHDKEEQIRKICNALQFRG